ncbi:MAG: META domain-containing protein [Vicinamibacteria bacterium]
MKNLIFVIATALLASCSDLSTDPGGVNLLEGTWYLESLEPSGATIVPVSDPARYTASFDADGRLGVRADCNQCSSVYSVEGAALDIGGLACTRAYCGTESLFDDYVAALDDAASFDGTRTSLTVRSPRGTLRFLRGP